MPQTMTLTTEDADIKAAAEIIQDGGLVAFPTETVYGLGANALNSAASSAIYEAKGRPSDNPMIVHIADISALPQLVKGGRDGISIDAIRVMREFWPGPLTIVFKKSDIVPDVVTGGLDTVAVRMPSNEIAHRLLEEAGVPVAAPSANLSGKPSPTREWDVIEDMNGRINAIIMGGQCDVGIESTVLDLTGDEPVILRPGYITPEQISEVIGREVRYDEHLTNPEEDGDNFHPKSPGMKYKHYSPNARVRLIEADGDEYEKVVKELGIEAMDQGLKPALLNYEGDAEKAAHKLFADLRELDRRGYDIILIKTLDEEGFGFSVMNRMLRSAGYDVVGADYDAASPQLSEVEAYADAEVTPKESDVSGIPGINDRDFGDMEYTVVLDGKVE